MRYRCLIAQVLLVLLPLGSASALEEGCSPLSRSAEAVASGSDMHNTLSEDAISQAWQGAIKRCEAALAALPDALTLGQPLINKCRSSYWSLRSRTRCQEQNLRESEDPCRVVMIAIAQEGGGYCHYRSGALGSDDCLLVNPGLVERTLADLALRISRYSLPPLPKVIALAEGSRRLHFACVPEPFKAEEPSRSLWGMGFEE